VDINEVTGEVIGAAIEVHRELGPGLLESTYVACLAYLLWQRGMHVEREVSLPLSFHDLRIEGAYRIDLLVERCLVIEIKTVAQLTPVHYAQLNTYLRFSGCHVGLLMNFNVTRLRDGLKRVVRGYVDPTPRPPRTFAPSASEAPSAPFLTRGCVLHPRARPPGTEPPTALA
jgi:GxxExxY protein